MTTDHHAQTGLLEVPGQAPEVAASQQYELTARQEEIRLATRQIAEEHFRPQALRWERTGEFPKENLRLLAEAGLLGMSVPTEYGGGGGSWLEAAVILEEVARTCYTTAMAALGELGVQTRALAAYGTLEAKQRFLPRIADGSLVCSICITEPDTGSDLRALSTRAESQAGGYVVNGTKALISRGDVSDLFLVYVRFDDQPGAAGVGAVIIERSTPGFSASEPHETLGGESLYDLHFEDCRIPAENVLVPAGGLSQMLTAFNGQRTLNAAISVGLAQGAQDAAIQYSKQRVQGGRPIGDYQGIGWMMADNAIQIEAARLLVRRAAARAGAGFPSRFEAAVAKTHANEMALTVTDSVMQIHGGHGWLRSLPAERYLRWARYGPLGGGTPQIQRNGIARHLLKERGTTGEATP